MRNRKRVRARVSNWICRLTASRYSVADGLLFAAGRFGVTVAKEHTFVWFGLVWFEQQKKSVDVTFEQTDWDKTRNNR